MALQKNAAGDLQLSMKFGMIIPINLSAEVLQ